MIGKIHPVLAGVALALILSSCLLAVVVGGSFLINRLETNDIPPAQPVGSEREFAEGIPLNSIPSPLAIYEFPSEVIDYPSGWPTRLIYPDKFQLVDASSGAFPGAIAIGYTAILLYEGDPREAADLMVEHLTASGWVILDRIELGSQAILLIFDDASDGSSGMLTIEPDASRRGFAKILALAFP